MADVMIRDLATGRITCYPRYCMPGEDEFCKIDPGACAPPKPGVHVISAADMGAWCTAVDAKGACEDFRTPSKKDVSDFDAQLPQFLTARGHAALAPRIGSYVRQYWAVVRGGQLYIVGNFVCASILRDDGPSGSNSLATNLVVDQSPIVVDDAGTCSITATFPVLRPDDVTFDVG